jgi:uncharacterized protein (TIGR02594 family)
MNKPAWIVKAEKYIGLKEVPGKGNNPTIVKWLINMKAWWRDDLTPWCGTFVDTCLRESGLPVAKAGYRAKSWLDWGVKLESPVYGCVVVFDRKGGGHVGFVVGRDEHGNLMVLGGNQSDAVNVAPFKMERVAGYRWPSNVMLGNIHAMPTIASNGKVSTNEA